MDIDKPNRDGYVSDSYYASVPKSEQSPVVLSYIAAAAGYMPPDPAQGFRYLELGCGIGTSLNLLAAACPGASFEGIDINVDAIDIATAAAREFQLTNVSYRAAAFSDVQAAQLSEYDYIVCQGTYSWLPGAEKTAVQRIVDESLKPAGIFHLHYVSFSSFYMTGMWHVLRQLVPDDGRDSVERVRDGLRLLGELRDAGAVYLKNFPQAEELLSSLDLQSMTDSQLSNLAHNILAESLAPTYFDDIAGDLQRIGLGYCGDIDTRLNDPELCLPSSLQGHLADAKSPVQREFLKEFCLSNYGRKDVYIRAKEPAPPRARSYLRHNVAALVAGPPAEAWRSIATQGKRSFYQFDSPLMAFVFECIVAGEYDLDSIIEVSEYDAAALEDAFKKLLTCQCVELCMASALVRKRNKQAPLAAGCRFNELMLSRSLNGAADCVLVAPALAGWVRLTRAEALFTLDVCENGHHDCDSVARQRLVDRLTHRGSSPCHETLDVLADERQWALSRQDYLAHCLPRLIAVGALCQCG